MTTVTIDIARDPEAPEFWLASFVFAERDYVTQGYTIEEARFMAGDLLRQEGVPGDATVRFHIFDEARLAALPRAYAAPANRAR